MNTQKPEPLVRHPHGAVEVHTIFSTIQGEGIFAGQPAIFVRLSGCNLKCPMCDTEYTEHRNLMTPLQVADTVRLMRLKLNTDLVVVTGGEPFRQNLVGMVGLLIDQGCRVQLETNGTLPPTLEEVQLESGRVFIMCSPKTGRLDEKLAKYVSAYKYVIDHRDVNLLDGLPTKVLGLKGGLPARPPKDFKGQVFVQPADAHNELINKLNLECCKDSVFNFGYTLCLQIHKLIKVE